VARANATQWFATERVIPSPGTSALDGQIRVNVTKTIWLVAHGVAGITGIILFAQLDALLIFLALTGLTICAGHSVGMHRLLIHRSFHVPRGVEYLLVWLGVLVGMAGPFGMIRAHDMRDWHQRQLECPPHPSHGAGFWRDAWWQLCCDFSLRAPPAFIIEDSVQNDRFYRVLEKTWMAQQIPLALVLYATGGWAWVLWGICLRIFVSLSGHWLVGHFAHRRGTKTGWSLTYPSKDTTYTDLASSPLVKTGTVTTTPSRTPRNSESKTGKLIPVFSSSKPWQSSGSRRR